MLEKEYLWHKSCDAEGPIANRDQGVCCCRSLAMLLFMDQLELSYHTRWKMAQTNQLLLLKNLMYTYSGGKDVFQARQHCLLFLGTKASPVSDTLFTQPLCPSNVLLLADLHYVVSSFLGAQLQQVIIGMITCTGHQSCTQLIDSISEHLLYTSCPEMVGKQLCQQPGLRSSNDK